MIYKILNMKYNIIIKVHHLSFIFFHMGLSLMSIEACSFSIIFSIFLLSQFWLSCLKLTAWNTSQTLRRLQIFQVR